MIHPARTCGIIPRWHQSSTSHPSLSFASENPHPTDAERLDISPSHFPSIFADLFWRPRPFPTSRSPEPNCLIGWLGTLFTPPALFVSFMSRVCLSPFSTVRAIGFVRSATHPPQFFCVCGSRRRRLPTDFSPRSHPDFRCRLGRLLFQREISTKPRLSILSGWPIWRLPCSRRLQLPLQRLRAADAPFSASQSSPSSPRRIRLLRALLYAALALSFHFRHNSLRERGRRPRGAIPEESRDSAGQDARQHLGAARRRTAQQKHTADGPNGIRQG